DFLYYSTNGGADWFQTSAPASRWFSVAVSADGARMIAVSTTGLVYLSPNAGATWEPMNAPAESWTSVASSADGKNLTLVAGGSSPGPIYRSSDSGKNWQAMAAPTDYWNAIASSADGSRLVAAIGGYAAGGIYIEQTASAAPPALTIDKSGNSIRISWPATVSGFVLEENSRPTATANWSTVNLAAVQVNGMNRVDMPAASGSHFFRLRGQ